MSMNTKRNRGGTGRMNSGQNNKRNMYHQQDRQQRPRVDKNVYIEGVYKNQRFTHVLISLVGTIVQVQVKNEFVYEGVLKTFSQKGDCVLEMAHMVEDMSNGSQHMTPSRDRIIDKLIIKASDLVAVNAANIELDYAIKGDSFTDTGISKFNGEVKERDMKELQPWESEGGDEISLDTESRSNGWDVNDMFKTNAQQFNVKSSYDESLAQYTTRLDKDNTSEEYRAREEKARRMAAEIEGSEAYRKHIALENGEGDNEEALFSSVVRPNEQSASSGASKEGKYVPPNRRNNTAGGNAGMSRPPRGNYPQQQQQHPHQQQHSQHPSQGPPPHMGRQSSYPQSPPATQHAHPMSPVEPVNGEDPMRSSIPAGSTAGPTVKPSPVNDQGAPTAPVENKHDHSQQYNVKTDKKKGRDDLIKDLKEFSSNFKLDEKDPKEKGDCEKSEKDIKSANTDSKNKETTCITENKETNNSDKVVTEEVVPMVTRVSMAEKTLPTNVEQKSSDFVESQSQSSSPQEQTSEASKAKESLSFSLSSNLNPNAHEFVPSATKSFQPKQSIQQITTPPRPQTQSPIIQNIPAQQFQYNLQQIPTMVSAQQQQNMQTYNHVRPKRAVVSVKPTDYSASAAQLATGQPLLAQSPQHPYISYIPHPGMLPPQPTGYQMGQMMPMPAAAQATGQRFITPTSIQGMPPTSNPTAGQMEPSNPQAQPAGPVYVANQPQPGPMPAHMSHNSHLNHHTQHMGHMNMSNPQQNPSTQQHNPSQGPPSQPHHNPAPSPVHTNMNQPGMPHPPSSGTPQPPQGYPQGAQLQGHPPLQPSPHNHNPTSPHTSNMQPMPFPYQQNPHQQQHHFQMQGNAAGAQQQFSMPNQQSNVPTSVTYSMQTHTNSPHMQHQFVVMPPHQSGQLNHTHLHGSHFPGHIVAGSMQPQMMSQSGVQGIPGQTPTQAPHPQTHQIQQHFPIQVHNHGGQSMQNYQSSQ